MTDYDFALDLMTPDPSTVKRNKKKINELLDKYGSLEAIRQNADLADSINYDFIHGDELIDEVLRERAEAKNSPQLQNPLLQTNQATLAREARDVRKAYHHDDNNNTTTQYADNEYVDTKSDAQPTADTESNDDEKEVVDKNMKISQNLEFRKQLSDLEGGLYTYPYLDSQNIFTIGNGINIQNIFDKLPWVDIEGNRITDPKIIEGEKNKLIKIREKQQTLIQKYGKKASAQMRKATAFENMTFLRLPKSFLLAQENELLESMEVELQQNIDNYNKAHSMQFHRKILDLNKMPTEYAWALLELKYNLGGAKMNAKAYSHLFEGLIQGDKQMILHNIQRLEHNNNDRKRNMWAQQLLKKTNKLPSVSIK